MRRSEPVYAIPSWINGRAILQAARHFQDIRNPVTSAVVRRAPLCGRENLAEAMRCAQASLSSWTDLGETGRRQRLTALGDALVTAEIWLRLIPLLQEQGIHTLRQAR